MSIRDRVAAVLEGASSRLEPEECVICTTPIHGSDGVDVDEGTAHRGCMRVMQGSGRMRRSRGRVEVDDV